MALGAAKLQVLKMVLKQASSMAVVGVSIGLALSIAGQRVLSSGLGPEAVRPLNPVWLTATVIALLITTLLAAAIPARHAMRIYPQRALRQE